MKHILTILLLTFNIASKAQCIPSQPSNVVVNTDSTTIEFNWDKDECADKYVIRYRKLNTFSWYSVSVKNIPFKITLPKNSVFVYQVSALNSRSTSSWTDFKTIIVP